MAVNVEKLSITLTPEMAGSVRQVVERGEYASTSEVIREALREWKLRRSGREQAIEELRRLWDEGVNSGPAVDGEEAFARLKARLEARLPKTD